ncbi:MAG: MBL fold metallo-hydrolase [archaeon]|nr:MBL fold metallo-hydrolase [archaeon]
MNQLDILVVGSLTKDKNGEILNAYSTSTLVRTKDEIIVVDTSSYDKRLVILSSLEHIGVSAKDVSVVILTHSHTDHTSNNDIFPNARILVHAGENNNIPHAEIIEKDIILTEGVELKHTPGHTLGSMSVFVNGKNKKYVIAGDAIPLKDNFIRRIPPTLHVCKNLAEESLKMISKYADVVIPGHDQWFKTR